MPAEPVLKPATLEPLDRVDGIEALTLLSNAVSPHEMTRLRADWKSHRYDVIILLAWKKAMHSLKRELARLGVDFLAAVLGQSGREFFAPRFLSDRDAVAVARDLGFHAPDLSLRLHQLLDLVNSIKTKANPMPAESSPVTEPDCIICLQACSRVLLAANRLKELLAGADRLYPHLSESTLDGHHPSIQAVVEASPLLKGAVVRAAVATIATSSSSTEIRIAGGNLKTLLPLVWRDLFRVDKWHVGEVYSDLHREGRSRSSGVIRDALLAAGGFDFVPIGTRSQHFSEAAARLLEANQAYGSAQLEPDAARELARLGPPIPAAALAATVQAALCSWLGKRFSRSVEAQYDVSTILTWLHEPEWHTYLEEALPLDEEVLYRLELYHLPAERWVQLWRQFEPPETLSEPTRMLVAANTPSEVSIAARMLASKVT